MTLTSESSAEVGTHGEGSLVIDPEPAIGRASATVPCEFSGPEAADLAGISYRQLDYWARQGWVVPSRVCSDGVPRRMYAVSDVVRLAALGHLGKSRVDVATYGAAIGRLRVSESEGHLIVFAIHEERVQAAAPRDLRHVISDPGRYVIFDTAPVVRELRRRRADASERRPRRRTFTSEYKLKVLVEYDRLTAPGAKGRLLQREGLHTSHLVAWRRWRDVVKPARAGGTPAGAPRPRSAG